MAIYQASGLATSFGQIPSPAPFIDAQIVVSNNQFVDNNQNQLNFSSLLKRNTVQLQITEIQPPKINVIGSFNLEHTIILHVKYLMTINNFLKY